MARLVVTEGVNKGKVYDLTEDAMTIGRDSSNSIVFLELAVSRRHAEVARRDGFWTVRDLGSKNGSRVNGTLIKSEIRLRHGDVISLGKATMRFEEDDGDASDVVLAERPFDDDPATIIRPIRSLLDSEDISSGSMSLFDGLGADASSSPATPIGLRAVQPADVTTQADRRTQHLSILYQVAKELISVKPLDEVLELVMDLVFKVFRCDRGFLFLIDPDTGDLVPKVVRYRSTRSRGPERKVTISRTIAHKVIEEKVSVLTSDALVDPRFHGGESIQLYGIRSAMCVPLWNRDQILGIIHVDSLLSTGRFTPDDLDLLATLANQAAIGIENARLTEQLKEEAKIRANLSRYHSPWVVDRILAKKETRMEPEERVATVLFSDIVGFTPQTENMDPRLVATLLNEYFTLMTDAIFEYEGTLDKYMGDAIMALFGLPFAHPNDEERAVLAALKMNQLLEKYNAGKPPEHQFRHRIGILTGRVVAGDVGSNRRMEYTALGDTVNSAQRIESMVAKPGQVVIGEPTYLKVADKFVTRDLGCFALKGKERKLRAYEVLSVLETPSVTT